MALTQNEMDTVLRDFEISALSDAVFRRYNLEMLDEAARLYGERATKLRSQASATTAALLEKLDVSCPGSSSQQQAPYAAMRPASRVSLPPRVLRSRTGA